MDGASTFSFTMRVIGWYIAKTVSLPAERQAQYAYWYREASFHQHIGL